MTDRTSNARLRKNFISLFTLQGANYLLPLATVPYLIRVLGPANFGKIAFAQALIQYFSTFVDYGFGLSATQRASVVRDNKQQLSRLFFAVFYARIILLIIGFAVLEELILPLNRFSGDTSLYELAFLLPCGQAIIPMWFLQGIQKTQSVAIFSVAAKVITTISVFLFVRNSEDYRIAIAIISASTLIASVPSLISVYRTHGIRFVAPNVVDIGETFVDGWHAFVSMFGLSFYAFNSSFILGLFAAPLVVGYYSAAEKLMKAMQGILLPVSQTVYPHIAHLLLQSQTIALRFVRRLLVVQSTMMLAFSLCTIIFARNIVHLLFGAASDPSISILRWLALVPFVVSISNVLGMQVMMNFGMKRHFSRVMIVSSFVYLAICIPSARNFGACGAAFTLVLTECFSAAGMAVILYKKGYLCSILLGSEKCDEVNDAFQHPNTSV